MLFSSSSRVCFSTNETFVASTARIKTDEPGQARQAQIFHRADQAKALCVSVFTPHYLHNLHFEYNSQCLHPKKNIVKEINTAIANYKNITQNIMLVTHGIIYNLPCENDRNMN